ncbi:MAG: small multi-drug export protein [Thermodesulfobacteriota bacterium]|nr:small multi-drug export protein [Thermodesulfobacteriota bacterium]
MMDLVIFLKNNLAEHFVIYFIPLYIVGGRPVAILSAQFLGYKASFLLPVVVMLDTLQVPLFYYLYGAMSGSLLVRKFSERTIKKEKRLSGSKFFHWMQVMGAPGVVAVTMLPIKGCGMWSGVLLSKLLKFSRPTSYPLLIVGSILGCAFLLGLGEGILKLWALFMSS